MNSSIARGIPKEVLESLKREAPLSYRFLTEFPYRIYQVKWRSAPGGSDIKTELKHWIWSYINSITQQSQSIHVREKTFRDEEIIRLASYSKGSRKDIEIIQSHLDEMKINLEANFLIRISPNRVEEILLTEYLTPLFNLEDYKNDFFEKVFQLRNMELSASSKKALDYVHKWTLNKTSFKEYLGNFDRVKADFDLLNNVDRLSNLPKILRSKILTNLLGRDYRSFLTTSKVNKRVPLLEVEIDMDDYPYKTLTNILVIHPARTIVSIKNLDLTEEESKNGSLESLLSLRVLALSSYINKPLGKLPPGLQTLTLGYFFNQPLGVLPPRLHTLTLDYSFDQPLGKLPPGLQTLNLSYFFDQPLGVLPPGLQTLTLGYFFNQSLGDLPPGLQTLNLDYSFDQPLGVLPPGLQTLILGYSFNQHLGVLPHGLQTLTLGYSFNQHLGVLPPNLKFYKK